MCSTDELWRVLDPGDGGDDARTVQEPAASTAFPRVPAHAWAWLQRSRPVVTEVALRLTGVAPGPGFVDELRAQVSADEFVRDVLIDVVADIAFGGRVPARRPPGASWDRGLIWWAAALSGTTPADYEARGNAQVVEPALFGADDQEPHKGGPHAAGPPAGARPLERQRPRAGASPRRQLLIAALRDLLAAGDGAHLPAAAVRALLAELEATPPR